MEQKFGKDIFYELIPTFYALIANTTLAIHIKVYPFIL